MGTYGGILKLYNLFGNKTEHSDVAMYGGISKIYIIHISIYLFFCFTDKLRGTKTEHFDVAMYGGRIHVSIFFCVRFDQSTVATYGGLSKLFIIHIRIIYSLISLTKFVGRKLNTLVWLRIAGVSMSIYISIYDHLANVSSIESG